MFRLTAAITVICFSAGIVSAETVELRNGDTLKGSIISMDSSTVKIRSQSTGMRTLKRANIAQITFVERPETKRRSFSLSEMLRELRAEGIDDQAWNDIKKRLNVAETQEVRRYFDDTIAGLKDDMKNLRQDAEEVQKELTELRKEYGPKADTLNDYIGALQNLFSTNADAKGKISGNVDAAREASDKNRTSRTTPPIRN